MIIAPALTPITDKSVSSGVLDKFVKLSRSSPFSLSRELGSTQLQFGKFIDWKSELIEGDGDTCDKAKRASLAVAVLTGNIAPW